MADDSKDSGSWWKTIPGILTGIGSTLAAAAALVAALSQAGLLGNKKPPEVTATAQRSPSVAAATSVTIDETSAPPAAPTAPAESAQSPAVVVASPPVAVKPKPKVDRPPAATTATARNSADPRPTGDPALPTAPPAAGRNLFAQLAQANIHNSVGDATMKSWLADNDGGYRRLAEASLAVLAGRSLSGQGVDLDVVSYVYVKSLGIAGDDLPAQHQVRPALLRSALLQAHANKNGSAARSLDEIVR